MTLKEFIKRVNSGKYNHVWKLKHQEDWDWEDTYYCDKCGIRSLSGDTLSSGCISDEESIVKKLLE